MSCNGCRILRKGCSDDCMLRHCLQWIENPQAQAHATVYVAKFFGRAGLMSFVSNVPTDYRPALFQSLLFEAVGRTINPVNGAVGLLWTGNWHLCQLGVEKVLRDGTLGPLSVSFGVVSTPADKEEFGSVVKYSFSKPEMGLESRTLKRKALCDVEDSQSPVRVLVGGRRICQPKKQRAATPSEESEITTVGSSAVECGGERKLLRLFF